jgi:hypothetical protein
LFPKRIQKALKNQKFLHEKEADTNKTAHFVVSRIVEKTKKSIKK